MTRLVPRLLVFALPLLLAAAWVEWRLRELPTAYGDKRAMLDAEAPHVRLLVTGTSHEYYGIDPAELPCRAVNAANAMQSLPFDAALVAAYLPRMTSLEALVVGVSVFSLDFRIHDSPEDGRLLLYRAAFGLELPEEPLGAGPLARSLIAGYGPKQAIRLALSRSPEPLERPDARGWMRLERKGEVTAAAGATRARRHLGMMRRSHREANLAALRRMVDGARRAGAAVVLVLSPGHPTYLDALPPGEVRDLRAALAGLAGETGAVVSDHLEDPRFERGDFADPDHLSPEGARKLSRLLAGELAPLLRCIPPPPTLPPPAAGGGRSRGREAAITAPSAPVTSAVPR